MTVVNGGLNWLATQLAATYIYMGIGTGTTAVQLTDTALETEATSYRAECDTHSATGAVATFEEEFTIGAGGLALTEAGLFDSGTVGVDDDMFARQVFSVLSLNENDKVKITWTFTFANAA